MGIGGVIYPTLIEPRHLEVNRIPIKIAGLPKGLDGLTIAHLTDLHRSSVVSESYLLSAVETANDLKPDLIVFTGDYLTHERSHREDITQGGTYEGEGFIRDSARCLKAAKARYGVYACLGNHDHWYDGNLCATVIQEAGVPVLRNASTTITINGEALPIVGLGDLWTEGIDFAKAFDHNHAPFSLVLMHNPDTFENWPRSGAHLILSGHTHGGQVNIPFYGPPIVPSRFGQKYAHGLFQKDNTFMYVSRGVGLISPAVRFNCRPEIALIQLHCA